MSFPAFPLLAKMDRWVNSKDVTDIQIEMMMQMFSVFLKDLDRKYGKIGSYRLPEPYFVLE